MSFLTGQTIDRDQPVGTSLGGGPRCVYFLFISKQVQVSCWMWLRWAIIIWDSPGLTTENLTRTVGSATFPRKGPVVGPIWFFGTKETDPKLVPKGMPAAGHTVWQLGISCIT